MGLHVRSNSSDRWGDLLVIVLCHGGHEGLCCPNGTFLTYQQICDGLLNTHAPLWMDLPEMLLFDTCRGYSALPAADVTHKRFLCVVWASFYKSFFLRVWQILFGKLSVSTFRQRHHCQRLACLGGAGYSQCCPSSDVRKHAWDAARDPIWSSRGQRASSRSAGV